MFNISLIINRINNDTIYDAYAAPTADFNLEGIDALPVVYVGYAGITRVPAIPINMDFLDSHGEDLVQVFEVKIVSDLTNIVTVWQTVYKSLINYKPTLALGSTSSSTNLAFIGCETVQANGKVLDVARWAVGFPTTNVIV